jgi:MFS family permease
LVRSDLGLGDTQVAIALGAFGGGSMLVALALPRLLDNLPDRLVMIAGMAVLVVSLFGLSGVSLVHCTQWHPLLAGLIIIGIGYSTVLTPSGRLLKRSASPEDRPAVCAAQFALSHACWLATYPLAGWLITVAGPAAAMAGLALLAAIGIIDGAAFWPRNDAGALTRTHDDIPDDHLHLKDGRPRSHPIIIDDVHRRWPHSMEMESAVRKDA